jgi:DNA-binding IclR family transcriptional regulator
MTIKGIKMKNNSSVQSLDRGLKVLELLAENDRMTASAIAGRLGLHQSTASRLLNSLATAGLVCKPAFHSFSLDYGVLLFAGKMLRKFSLITAANIVCNRIMHEHGYLSMVGILFREHQVYLTRYVKDSSIVLIDDSDFPLHMSSIGRMLAYRLGHDRAIRLLGKSIIASKRKESAEEIYGRIDASVRKYGFLFMENELANIFNAAECFNVGNREMCLAIYSETKSARPEDVKLILNNSIKEIKGKIIDYEKAKYEKLF